MKKVKLLIAFLLLNFGLQSQVGVMGGFSNLRTFGASAFYGFNLGLEIPIDDASSYYGRLNMYSKVRGPETLFFVEAIDLQTTIPNYLSINSFATMNYNCLELGRRQYLWGSFDDSFGLYGGSFIQFQLNQFRLRTDDYDRSKYRIPNGYDEKGSAFAMGLGLHAGVKKSFPMFTVYSDVALNYLMLAVPSNNLAADNYGNFARNLFFVFNVGIRKDIY
jgi:hypothetical protein